MGVLALGLESLVSVPSEEASPTSPAALASRVLETADALTASPALAAAVSLAALGATENVFASEDRSKVSLSIGKDPSHLGSVTSVNGSVLIYKID